MQSKKNNQLSSSHSVNTTQLPGLRPLCALLLLSSLGWVSCKSPTATSKDTRKKLVLSSTLNNAPSQAVLAQTRDILKKRLQLAGISGFSIELKEKNIQVELPEMSAEKLKLVKEELLSRQGAIRLSPLVQKSETFSKISGLLAKSPGALKGVSFKKETWSGPDKAQHHTFSLQHKDKKTLEVAILGLQKADETAAAKNEKWVLKQSSSGLWSAYLIDIQQEMNISQAASVQANLATKGVSQDLNIRLNQKDGKKLQQLTARHLGNRLLLRIDKKIHSNPIVMAAITGSALRLSMLSGGDTHRLISLLGAGALPIPVQAKMRF